MISVRSSNLSLKYQRFTTSSSKDIAVSIFDIVPKTQFLWLFVLLNNGLIKEKAPFNKWIELKNSIVSFFVGNPV